MNPLFLLFPVFLPLAGGFAVLPLHFQEDRKRNLYTEGVVCLTSALVFAALFFCRREPVEIFRFTEGFSIAFRVDGLSSLFAGMVSLMWPLVMLYAFSYMQETKRKNFFFAFYVMTYGITLGTAFSANLTTLYVFYEMLTLVTIPLVFYYEDHESMYAGRKYAAYTIGGASLAFFAVIMATVHGDGGQFIYGGSLGDSFDFPLMQVVFLFGFFGFGAKAAVFPLNSWLPTASAAPTPVTALLHAVAVVNSGVFAIMRLTWYVYGPEYLLGTRVQKAALLTAAFTLLYAAALAVRERHFKRRLAESTVSNLSYMLYGVLLMTPAGFLAGLTHMVFHSITKMVLFLCAGAFMHVTGRSYVYEINGAGRRMPATFVFYTAAALSLTGIPLFACFISKWMLIMAGLEEGGPFAMAGAAALIISAFLCAVYSLTVSARAFFPAAGETHWDSAGGIQEADWRMLVPIAVFGCLILLFGVCPGPVLRFLEQIAYGLL